MPDPAAPPAIQAPGAEGPKTVAGEPAAAAPPPDPKAQAGDNSLLDQAGDKDGKPVEKPKDSPVVPEKYEFKAPEGMTLDQKAVEAFVPLAKELKLTQDQAQKVADLYTARVTSMREEQEAVYQSNMKAMREETIKALGADWEKEMSFAAKTRDRFFPASLMELFNATGLSNNKDFNLALIKIGREISEGKLPEGKTAGGGFDVQNMYPSMKKT